MNLPRSTKISWTQHTWNPVTGCDKVSPGCKHCYAERIAEEGSTKAFPRGFDLTLRPGRLRKPYTWKDPAFVFVNSMSDLFHEGIPDGFLQQVWAVMVNCEHLVFQVLTKRPVEMLRRIEWLELELPNNIWLGVSAENQLFADRRIPYLFSLPAAVRFVSCEPLLGPIMLEEYLPELQWVIAGGESGPGRRTVDRAYFRSLRDQCVRHKVPFWFKQGNAFRQGEDFVLDGQVWFQRPEVVPPVRAVQGGLF